MIPESQLETWSNQGATVGSANTYASLSKALPDFSFGATYLQGSYRNKTNVRGDSDVDMVVQSPIVLTQTGGSLTAPTYDAKAHIGWGAYRTRVIQELRNYYGWLAVSDAGRKSIKVKAENGRLAADVVPVITFHWNSQTYGSSILEGIMMFPTGSTLPVVNFPKIHYENGAEKNSEAHTNGWFKPFVRVVKNARNYLYSKNLLVKGMAPSYFVESLLYNVPDSLYGPTLQETYVQATGFLSSANLSPFTCQNGLLPLFGNSSTQWDAKAAKVFIQQLNYLWTNWYLI